MSPPPPTGTTIVSSERPCEASWESTSAATLPCPAMVSFASKGSTTVAPRSSASARAAAAASSKVSPVTTSSTASPPCTRMRLRFCRGVFVGTKIRPWMPSDLHAYATPWAWLPAEAATMPASRASSESWLIALYAPRIL